MILEKVGMIYSKKDYTSSDNNTETTGGVYYISDDREPAWLSSMQINLQKYLNDTSSCDIWHYNILRKYEISVNGGISSDIRFTQNDLLMKHIRNKYKSLKSAIESALDIPVFQYGFTCFYEFWSQLNNYANSCLLKISSRPIIIPNGSERIKIITTSEDLTKYLITVEKVLYRYITTFEHKKKQMIQENINTLRLRINVAYLDRYIMEFLHRRDEMEFLFRREDIKSVM